MEEAKSISEIKEQLKRVPESVETHKQLHDLETKRADRLGVPYRAGVKNILDRTKALEQISSVTVKARVKIFTAWRAVARHALLVLARAVLPRRKLGQPPACICSVAVKYLGDQDGKATK